jgi:Calcium-activated chloride channel
MLFSFMVCCTDHRHVPTAHVFHRLDLGARVAMYFVFVSFYARQLLGIAVLSIPAYTIYRLVSNEIVVASMRWIFGITLVVWTTWFLEKWKRRNATVNIDWGLHDYHEDTVDNMRPQFKGDLRVGFYCPGGFVPLDDIAAAASEDNETGVPAISLPRYPYHDPREGRKAALCSVFITAGCVALVTSALFALLWFRNEIIDWFVERGFNSSFANAVPGILNAVVISVSDPIWRWVSLVLTNRENHRTCEWRSTSTTP